MRRPRSDCYETQLTPEELASLHEMLLQPKLDLPKIQAAVPAWRDGPHAGCKPSLRTLSAVATRFRGHLHACELRDMFTQLHSMCYHAEGLPGLPTRPILKLICALLGHNLLQKITDKTFSETDTPLIRLLLKLEDQNIRIHKQRCPKERPQFVVDELFEAQLQDIVTDTHQDAPVSDSPSEIDREQSPSPVNPNKVPPSNQPPHAESRTNGAPA